MFLSSRLGCALLRAVLVVAGVGCASDGGTLPRQAATDSTKVPTDTVRAARQPGTYAVVDVNDRIGTDLPVRFNDRGDILTSSRRMVSGGQSASPPAGCLAYGFNNLGHVLCMVDQKHTVESYAIWNGSALVPITGLDTFPSYNFVALAINDSDVVAGSFWSPSFTNASCTITCVRSSAAAK